jgi:antitoxin ParD1/3/4
MGTSLFPISDPRMTVTLKPELEQMVREKVAAGAYATPDDVLAEGLRLLRERDEAEQRAREWLTREIQTGLDQLDRGEVVSGSDVSAELVRRSVERSSARPAHGSLSQRDPLSTA